MDVLANIIQPTIGILTSIGTAHQEGFETESEKRNEKWKLFENAQIIIAPLSALPIIKMDASHNLGAPSVITWCRSGAATLKIQSEKNYTGANAFAGKLPWNRFAISGSFYGFDFRQ